MARRRGEETQRQTPAGAAGATPAAGRSPTTHIAAGSRVVGDITGATDLIIEGRVSGKLDMQSGVMVGASGEVHGEIRARAVRVAGSVNGNVRGLEEIEILPQGRVEGDIVSPRVMISPGAFFRGKVDMDGGSETA